MNDITILVLILMFVATVVYFAREKSAKVREEMMKELDKELEEDFNETNQEDND